MDYIGLDTSLASTGLYIRKADGSEFYYNYMNTPKLSKWHKTLSFIEYKSYEILEFDNHSDNEVGKLIKYDQITQMIVADILKHCDPKDATVVTEGYSYSSSAGMIIHLVTYGTLVRNKLLSLGFADFIIKPPSTLKSDTCIKVYGPGEKKKPARNREGIAGGKFQKREMLQAQFESGIPNSMTDMLIIHKQELLERKAIPKPIDDMVDAWWLVNSTI